MVKEFVSYELSMELKELGFNEPCFGGYFTAYDRVNGNPITSVSICETKRQDMYHGQNCSAPLWQQAFRWFRDKHKLIATPVYVGGDYKLYDIIVHDDLSGEEIPEDPFVCKTYEDAEEECLKFLIKILRNRKS